MKFQVPIKKKQKAIIIYLYIHILTCNCLYREQKRLLAEDSAVFAVSKSETKPPVFHDNPLHNEELAILHDGDEIDFLSNFPHDMLVLSIDKDYINHYSIALLGKEVNAINTCNNRLKIKDGSSRNELVDLWEGTIDLALTSDQNLQDINFASTIEEELISSILCSSASFEIRTTRLERHRAAKLARQYILENRNKLLSILDICEELGATERALHLGFKELYNVTPKAFLKYLRLNYARKELMRAEPGCTVTKVAYRRKFYHLSRFARSYYEIFNQYLSETLIRSIVSNGSPIGKSDL